MDLLKTKIKKLEDRECLEDVFMILQKGISLVTLIRETYVSESRYKSKTVNNRSIVTPSTCLK